MDSLRQFKFFTEMSNHQVSENEFFSNILLNLIERNFGFSNTLITYFDEDGEFLSWVDRDGLRLASEEHPYQNFVGKDIVRYTIFQEAVRDKLNYFNVEPRIYQSTKIISEKDYETSNYLRYLEEIFGAHYCTTLAFGINAYIQVSFYKSKNEGDFSEEELELIKSIYVYISNFYKNFKKHEQAKIVSSIKTMIISTGEDAYFITDDFQHVMSMNKKSNEYLRDILGEGMIGEIQNGESCDWLPFLFGSYDKKSSEVITRVVKNYIFKINTYEQKYSNGIVDRYFWITVTKKDQESIQAIGKGTLTSSEQKIAELMYQGLTYQEIADELIVSYHTVKKHVQNIYIKCSVKSRHQLYKWIENK